MKAGFVAIAQKWLARKGLGCRIKVIYVIW